MNDRIMVIAHVLTSFDALATSLEAVARKDGPLQDAIELHTSGLKLRENAEAWAVTWSAVRGHPKQTYQEAVDDARAYLRVHIEKYIAWETALNARLDASD